jgi:hypothetical protein
MTILHTFMAHARGGLSGQQSAQADWSPYVVHFTNWSSMDVVRASLLSLEAKPSDIVKLIADADAKSSMVAEKILASGKLLAKSPSSKDGIPPCVCLSECNLPGLIGHAERYGRFGFVFRKEEVFRADGRPCAYLAEEQYTLVAELGRSTTASLAAQRLFGLSNIYNPPGFGKIQDYTHEREWRVFQDLRFDEIPPVALLAPSAYLQTMKWNAIPTLPLDMLHDWGA